MLLILCLPWWSEMYSFIICFWKSRFVWHLAIRASASRSGDKMALGIMWLPLRYVEVNSILWLIIWKLKTHSFSNLIPSQWKNVHSEVNWRIMSLIQMQMKFQFGVALGNLIDESPVDRYRHHPPLHQFPSSCRNNGSDGWNERSSSSPCHWLIHSVSSHSSLIVFLPFNSLSPQK